MFEKREKIREERYPDTPLERAEVIGRRKYRQREIVIEFTSKRDEGVKMMVNSSIRDLDSKGMSLSAKAVAARL